MGFFDNDKTRAMGYLQTNLNGDIKKQISKNTPRDLLRKDMEYLGMGAAFDRESMQTVANGISMDYFIIIIILTMANGIIIVDYYNGLPSGYLT